LAAGAAGFAIWGAPRAGVAIGLAVVSGFAPRVWASRASRPGAQNRRPWRLNPILENTPAMIHGIGYHCSPPDNIAILHVESTIPRPALVLVGIETYGTFVLLAGLGIAKRNSAERGPVGVNWLQLCFTFSHGLAPAVQREKELQIQIEQNRNASPTVKSAADDPPALIRSIPIHF
jgi:hypothetical protein